MEVEVVAKASAPVEDEPAKEVAPAADPSEIETLKSQIESLQAEVIFLTVSLIMLLYVFCC